MELQMIINVLNHPFESLFFFVGGVMVLAGISIASFFSSDRSKSKGILIMLCGAIVSSPAIFPLMAEVTGGDNNLSLIPTFVFNLIPIIGLIVLIVGWNHGDRKTRKTRKTRKI